MFTTTSEVFSQRLFQVSYMYTLASDGELQVLICLTMLYMFNFVVCVSLFHSVVCVSLFHSVVCVSLFHSVAVAQNFCTNVQVSLKSGKLTGKSFL